MRSFRLSKPLLPALLFLVATPVGGCAGRVPDPPLSEYTRHLDTERIVRPEGFNQYVKARYYPHGELDHLPTSAIILYTARVEDALKRAGYGEKDWTRLEIGESVSNVIYVVRPGAGGDRLGEGFIVNRGLPGAGGVAAQVSELGGLGVKRVVHLGSCGLLGDQVPDKVVVLATGSYKDGGAVLLSDSGNGGGGGVSRPDPTLTNSLARALGAEGVAYQEAVGYTIPVIYFQPSGLVKELLGGSRFADPRPAFVEMEEAPFFEAAKRMNMQAASLVVGSDRYTRQGDALKHDWLEG